MNSRPGVSTFDGRYRRRRGQVAIDRRVRHTDQRHEPDGKPDGPPDQPVRRFGGQRHPPTCVGVQFDRAVGKRIVQEDASRYIDLLAEDQLPRDPGPGEHDGKLFLLEYESDHGLACP